MRDYGFIITRSCTLTLDILSNRDVSLIIYNLESYVRCMQWFVWYVNLLYSCLSQGTLGQ
jgi:hypothetical protein